MAKGGRKRAPKRAPRRRMRRGGLTTKGKGNAVNDVAAVSESYTFNQGTWTANTIYADYGCALEQHPRASQVAAAYQEYRIKLVELKFKPLYDTFTVAAGTKAPYLYYLVDKLRANNGLNTVDGFRKAGAKPIRMDERTISVKYKPAVLTDVLDIQSAQSLPRNYRISPWLSTNDNSTISNLFNASSVDHEGIRWVLEGQPGLDYDVERIVHIEFRKPMWNEDEALALPVVNLGEEPKPVSVPEVTS